jgi:hypothetical protein
MPGFGNGANKLTRILRMYIKSEIDDTLGNFPTADKGTFGPIKES